MKKILVFSFCFLLITVQEGCVAIRKLTAPSKKPIQTIAALPVYSGPKARVTVADFEVKSAKSTPEIGQGLSEMLVGTLTASNRFIVFDYLKNNLKQQSEHGDLIITASLSEFEPEASGGRDGIGGGGGANNAVLGTLLGSSLNQAHMVLEIRIADAHTSEMLASKSIQGQASDIVGTIMEDSFNKQLLGSGLSIYANTPMEKAIRICIAEAVRFISLNTPAKYYKY